MERFEECKLSTHKRAILREDWEEIEMLVQDNVALYNRGEKQPRHEDGLARLTSHRLIYEKSGSATSTSFALALHLSQIISINLIAGFLTQSPKIQINLPDSSKGEGEESEIFVKLSFRGGGHQTFLNKLQQTLQNASWKKPEESKKDDKAKAIQNQKYEFDPSRAGIGGIMQSVEEKQKKTNEQLEEAFADLKQLMKNAQNLVLLAEKLSKKLEKDLANNENNAKDDSSLLKSYILDLGISSPVTRDTAGSAYHRELSKQLAEFLDKILKREGGMMTLPDVYCIFNRARGTALISPDDLVRACLLFDEIGLPFKLHKLKSGVLLVQGAEYDAKATQERILGYIRNRKNPESGSDVNYGMITALELAKLDRVSIIIAKEQLYTAEMNGAICRDETIEGLRYYENIIKMSKYDIN